MRIVVPIGSGTCLSVGTYHARPRGPLLSQLFEVVAAAGISAIGIVTASGAQGEPLIVAQTSGARTTGFPKLARSGSNVVLVWTQDAEPTRLRAVTIPIADIPAAATTSNN